MYKKIYIFRHGQTYYNKKSIFTGWKDSKLTSKGISDAKSVARELRNKEIDVAFSSHLSRSKSTLKIVLKTHKECRKLIVDDRIIERSYGDLEGKSHKIATLKMGEELYNVLSHWHKIDNLHKEDYREFISSLGKAKFKIFHRSYSHPPPNGESIKMVQKRVYSFIRWLLKYIKKNKVNVAISAHNNSMRPFRRYFENLTIKEMMTLENPFNKHIEYKIKV